MIIGTFTKTEDGVFEGEINTLTLNAELRIKPVEKSGDNGPDFRVYRSDTDVEVGAGWQKTSQKGNPYGSINIDDPVFPHPMWTALTKRDDGGYDLKWSRPRPKTDPDENGEL